MLGQTIALLIWNTEQENDAHVYLGSLIKLENHFEWSNTLKGWKLTLTNEQVESATKVPEEMKETFLNADYFISLSMGFTKDEDSNSLLPTGLKWH